MFFDAGGVRLIGEPVNEEHSDLLPFVGQTSTNNAGTILPGYQTDTDTRTLQVFLS
jgi:hypothetical protein